MSINIGDFANPKGGNVHIEISNNDQFIARVREINAEAREQGVTWPIRRWKIRHLGERVPAAIQKLIDQSKAIGESESLAAPGLDEAILPETTNQVVDIGRTATKPSEMGHDYMTNGGAELDEAIKNLEAVQAEHGIEVPPNPGPQIEGNIKPREKPKINPFTGGAA